MSDLIDRQAALDIAFKYCPDDDGTCSEARSDLRNMLDEIEALPPAQPEPKTGHWIPVDSYTAFGGDEITWIAHGNPIAYHYCSECKNQAYALEDGEDLLSDFCPSCGAKMLKEGE